MDPTTLPEFAETRPFAIAWHAAPPPEEWVEGFSTLTLRASVGDDEGMAWLECPVTDATEGTWQTDASGFRWIAVRRDGLVVLGVALRNGATFDGEPFVHEADVAYT